MGHWEWPLVLFTVLGQTSVGIIFCLWLLSSRRKKEGLTDSDKYNSFMKNSIILSGVLLIVALLSSLFHLGEPLAAYRALTHLSTSWLSREILLFGFTFVAWVYLAYASRKPGSDLTGILAITSVLGLLGVISSALIYTLPRVPAWNNLGPIFFFLLTTLILGALAVLVLGRDALESKENNRMTNWALGSVFAACLLYLLYFSFLKVTPEGAATAQFLLQSPIFWVRALVGWIIPLALLFMMGRQKGAQPQSTLIILALTCGVVGEILGRGLFYLSAIGIQITALM